MEILFTRLRVICVATVYHPALLSAVSLYSPSVSCLDAIIYQANQVNWRRTDQCARISGCSPDKLATLGAKERIKKEKDEEGGREGG